MILSSFLFLCMRFCMRSRLDITVISYSENRIDNKYMQFEEQEKIEADKQVEQYK